MLNRQKVRLFGLFILLFVALYLFFGFGSGSAFILFNRSVTISSGVPSATATHSFKFDIPTTSDIGSIVLDYCSNNPYFADSCTAPAGVDVSGATLSSQSGNTGFTIDSADTTTSTLVISRPTAPGITTTNSYVFSGIINPSTAGLATYVRISTHAAIDGSGPAEDTGAVAFAVQNTFEVDAFVPPFLQICVGITVAPDCSTTSGDSIDLGILSSQHANDGQSQFAVATNDINGYSVFTLGTTMTSGNDTIQNLPTPTPSFPGTQQFGINLRANLLPPVGQDPVGLGTGVPAADYNIPNKYIFNDGDSIAASPLTTNYNRMTVSYLVNVPSKQVPGIYATTVTYAATVQF
jgi:hypothetical protein